MLDANALSRDILNYDAIGNNHRTATPNDQQTINSPVSAPAWPIPVALAGQKQTSLVKMAIEQCEKVRLIITGDFQHNISTANVIGYLDRSAKEWIVLMTPHSGWFRCSGERGPGIALLLGLAHWASLQKLKVNFVFVTASGHELGMIGENLFIKKCAPEPRKVRFWLHLGASIATRSWQNSAQKQVNPVAEVITHREVMPLLSQSNAAAPIFQHPVDVEAFIETLARDHHKDRLYFGRLAAYSESKHLAYVTAMQAGYRPMCALAGCHAQFHTQMDGPFTIDTALLESIGKTLTEIIIGIDNAVS